MPSKPQTKPGLCRVSRSSSSVLLDAQKNLWVTCMKQVKTVFLSILPVMARAEEKKHGGTEADAALLLRALWTSVVQSSSQKRGSVRASKMPSQNPTSRKSGSAKVSLLHL